MSVHKAVTPLSIKKKLLRMLGDCRNKRSGKIMYADLSAWWNKLDQRDRPLAAKLLREELANIQFSLPVLADQVYGILDQTSQVR